MSCDCRDFFFLRQFVFPRLLTFFEKLFSCFFPRKSDNDPIWHSPSPTFFFHICLFFLICGNWLQDFYSIKKNLRWIFFLSSISQLEMPATFWSLNFRKFNSCGFFFKIRMKNHDFRGMFFLLKYLFTNLQVQFCFSKNAVFPLYTGISVFLPIP